MIPSKDQDSGADPFTFHAGQGTERFRTWRSLALPGGEIPDPAKRARCKGIKSAPQPRGRTRGVNYVLTDLGAGHGGSPAPNPQSLFELCCSVHGAQYTLRSALPLAMARCSGELPGYRASRANGGDYGRA
jgi:hypothetical protein